MNNKLKAPAATIFRRFAALVYDTFIIISLLILATSIALLLNKGESFLAVQYYFLSYLLLVVGLFTCWFWRRSGQTLGMLSWKVKLVQSDHSKLTWKKAWLRYALAFPSLGLCGIGLLWCLVDKEHQSLHDRLSGTRLVQVKS